MIDPHCLDWIEEEVAGGLDRIGPDLHIAAGRRAGLEQNLDSSVETQAFCRTLQVCPPYGGGKSF